jgi:hypothetical protein
MVRPRFADRHVEDLMSFDLSRRRAVVVVVIAVLALGACGDDGDAATTTTDDAATDDAATDDADGDDLEVAAEFVEAFASDDRWADVIDLTAPASDARRFAEAMTLENAARATFDDDVPFPLEHRREGERFHVEFPDREVVLGDFEVRDGDVSDFSYAGTPIGMLVAEIGGTEVTAAGLRVSGRFVFHEEAADELWVIATVETSEEVDLTGLEVLHRDDDAGETPVSNLPEGLTLEADTALTVTMIFPGAEPGGTLVFAGTIAGEPLDESMALPDPG